MTTDPFEKQLQDARDAVQQQPDDLAVRLRFAECLLLNGQVRQAIEEADLLETLCRKSAMDWTRVGAFHTQCGRHEAAHRCHLRAVEYRPGDAGVVYNAASSAVALGKMTEAEKRFEEVIFLDPADHDAWQNRSTLRTWSEDENHVQELAYVASRLAPEDPGQAPIHYALAKELEDLGRFDESFAALQSGAMARRRRLSYDVADDEAALAEISTVFDRHWLDTASQASAEPGPVFVLGLPRSGTTLTDRILSAHPGIDSLGEINTLALAVTRLAGAAQDRLTLIGHSARIDPATLGAQYIESSRGYGLQTPWLIDKTPLNFLYLGLISRALPGAKVIHLRRNPLDSCYAIYKTLFRMGYPFSYSLQDVGRYYLAYHRLMAHWRDLLGDFILDVDYEALVAEPETQARRILAFIGLDWDPACLEFHRSAAPAATASAAQVRQPIYRSSVERWRSYERQLAPLAGKLRERGLKL